MGKIIYKSRFFRITHTIEEEGPHPTIPYDYYDDAFTITILIHGNGCCYIEGTSCLYQLQDITVIRLLWIFADIYMKI